MLNITLAFHLLAMSDGVINGCIYYVEKKRLTNSIKSLFFAHRITSQLVHWAQNIAIYRLFKISFSKFNKSYSLKVLVLLKRRLRRQSANDTDLQIGRLLVRITSIVEQLALRFTTD